MGKFVKHESCPKCGSRDNLARYDDGSAWCFGCHYQEGKDGRSFNPTKVVEDERPVLVPDDLCNNFPRHVVEWLGKYDVSVPEALKYGWKYSKRLDQLVFSYYDQEGKLACTQARNFWVGAKTKYFNQGSPAEVLPIFRRRLGTDSADRTDVRLVIVEDAVSAARIARLTDAMPCLGSYLPAKKLAALKRLKYEQLVFWLDSDKLKEAYEMSTMAKWLGFSTRVVHTELDPKEYSDKEICLHLKFGPTDSGSHSNVEMTSSMK